MSTTDNEELDSTNQQSAEDLNTNASDVNVSADDTTEGGGQEKTFTEAEMKMFARAKKAEAEARALKAKLKELEKTPQQTIKTPSIDTDELKLIARGVSDEVIEQAKIVAKGKQISLIEAVNDPLIKSFEAEFKEKIRKEKAKLSASNGSGNVQNETFRSGMTDEEHKALWKKMQGA